MKERQLHDDKAMEEREFQIRRKELELAGDNHHHTLNPNSNFDLAKNIRLVPIFREKKIDKYFILNKYLLYMFDRC